MKKISLFIISILSFLSVNAQQEIAAYFASMPDELMPLLEINRRKDLIDLYNNNKEARIENSLKDITSIETLKDNYILLLSDSSRTDIALLPMVNDSYIICMINTVCGPVCDSEIRFFTTEWKLLQKDIFLSPADSEWFIKKDADKTSNEFIYLSSLLDMDLMQYQIDPDKLELLQKYNTPLYLNKSDREKLQPFLKEEPKIYQWNKMRFQ